MPLYFAIALTIIFSVIAFAVVSVWAFFVVIPSRCILIGYVLLAAQVGRPAGGDDRAGADGALRHPAQRAAGRRHRERARRPGLDQPAAVDAAAASCPQAASMSRPRVSRTVARRPCSSSTALKAAIAPREEPS